MDKQTRDLGREWLKNSSWGMMFHYIDSPASSNSISSTTAAEWNQRIDGFDVRRFADQVRELQADYIIFTLGQNTGHFCSPNATYDGFIGLRPSKLSKRDLIAEIATTLQPEVKVIAYLPSHAPVNDREAVRQLKLLPPWDGSAWGLSPSRDGAPHADDRLTEFQLMWERVIAEWGQRWGDLVSGWWIDGCYYADRMYADPVGPNFKTFAAALRAGSPNRILAFNSGTDDPFFKLTAEQDYTAGEVSTKFPVTNRWEPLFQKIHGMHLHVLTYLGDWWGAGAPRFSDAFVDGYTRHINGQGGVVTWDVPITRDGEIPEEFRRQLRTLAIGQDFPSRDLVEA